MFQPAAFREDDLDAQLALVRAHPLGLLVSHGEQGLTADPLPFLADVEQGQIRLRAHWRAPTSTGGGCSTRRNAW